jgi:outer membrane lipoprotein-sorting protein
MRLTLFIASVLLALSAMVSAETADIPDAAAMLRDVRAHQAALDAIRENYTFHRIRRTDDVDANGKVKSSNSVEREIFFVHGFPVGRTLKRNGVALSAQEEKSEDDNVRKAVAKALKTPGGGGPAAGRTALVSDILAVTTISNPRRVSLNGRSALAYDFRGDPKAHAHTMQQNAAKKLFGTIWFDEADRQVAQLEVQLDDNFKVGGGLLADVRKGTTLRVNQSPVGEGLWMQTSNEQHLDLRIVLVKGYRQNVHVQDFDFKKFDVGAVQKVEAPR